MATRRIPQDEMVFVVTNTGSHPVVVANRRVNVGKSEEIPVRYVSGDLKRCQAMAALQTSHNIGVQLKYSNGGVVATGVDSAYMLSLQASTSGVMGTPPVYPAADRPANVDVPQGFQVYNEDTDAPNYNDGAAWVDGAGTPV